MALIISMVLTDNSEGIGFMPAYLKGSASLAYKSDSYKSVCLQLEKIKKKIKNSGGVIALTGRNFPHI